MGEVYRARDGRLGRGDQGPARELRRRQGATRRFETEARAAAAISHPNVLVHDVSARPPFVVFELEGQTLRADGRRRA
jgi:hypothetical protein